MNLVERDQPLTRLAQLLEAASGGAWACGSRAGEAGIGKTTVVKQFVSDLDDNHVMWGGCDDLVAARPLGPVWDMALDEVDDVG